MDWDACGLASASLIPGGATPRSRPRPTAFDALNPGPVPVLGTLVPLGLHALRPWRRGWRRRDVQRGVGRRVSRPLHPPVRRRWRLVAFTGPDIPRPLWVTLWRSGHAVRIHARVALGIGRADRGRRDRDSRQRNSGHDGGGGHWAKKPCHGRPLGGRVFLSLGAQARLEFCNRVFVVTWVTIALYRAAFGMSGRW